MEFLSVQIKQHPARSAIIAVVAVFLIYWVFLRGSSATTSGATSGATTQDYEAMIAEAQTSSNQLAAVQTAAQTQVAQTQITTAAATTDEQDLLAAQLTAQGNTDALQSSEDEDNYNLASDAYSQEGALQDQALQAVWNNPGIAGDVSPLLTPNFPTSLPPASSSGSAGITVTA